MTSLAINNVATSSSYGDLIPVVVNGVITDALWVGSALGTQQTEILQGILQRLRIFLGEWFMDTTIGVDYFGQVLVKNPDVAAINALLIAQILAEPGVNLITAFSFTPNFVTRIMQISFSCQTTAGIVNYAGLL